MPLEEPGSARFAWTFAAALLCLVLPARLADAASNVGPAGVAAAAALFVLPLLYTIPRGRVLWERHRGWLLAAQTVLTYVPFAVFGPDWIVGLSGLLAGLLLLTVGAAVSWALLGAILAVEGVLRIAVLPLAGASWALTVWAFTTPVNIALALFGLVRLADLVTDLHATQTELAALAATQQRLRAATRLRAAIGDRLETVTAHARTALPVLARSPDQARGELAAAAEVARQALDQVRMVAADDRDPSPPRTTQAGDTVAPRLARLGLVVVLCAVSVQLLANLLATGVTATAAVGAAVVIVTVVALQLRHSLARPQGAPPRGWPWTLAVQTLVSFAFLRVYDEVSLLAMAGFSAGSALLLLPGWWAWAAFVAIPAGVGALTAAYLPDSGIAAPVYSAAGAATTGVVVYGLSRLTDLAHRVEAARRELARMAAAQERLRVARDTHDMLGLGLSAVALKCDLVVRLIDRDDARARSELEQLLEIAANARGEVLAVTGATDHRLSLETELAAARDTLASAGVEIRAGVPAAPLPPLVDAVLATVLREAVTNVLRHTTATQCDIELSTTGEVIRLRITNDGVRSPDATSTGGAGLDNLRARVRAVGGGLTAGPDGDDRFALAAQIPATPP